jgi:hypothetical protein
MQINQVVFPADGLYAPSPGCVSLIVECVGGGGAGGGVEVPFVGPDWIFGCGGGGGGAGAYARKLLQVSQVLGGVVVTVGQGGVPVAGANGGLGGNSSFGALCVAGGGQGGFANVISGSDAGANQIGGWGEGGWGGGWGASNPGAGNSPLIGDVACVGNSGFTGQTNQRDSTASFFVAMVLEGKGGGGPYGGASPSLGGYGGGAQPGVASWANTGGGGSGGVSFNAGATPGPAVAGGPGGSGFVVVTEYIFSNGGADDASIPTFNVNARVKVTEAGRWPPRPGGGPPLPWTGGNLEIVGDEG